MTEAGRAGPLLETPAATRDDESASLRIGELARPAGVSVRTIRYCEELGILPSSPRSGGGSRRYTIEYVRYIAGARELKELGLGLEEIAELFRFLLSGGGERELSEQILSRRIAELRRQARVVSRLCHFVATTDPLDGPELAIQDSRIRDLSRKLAIAALVTSGSRAPWLADREPE